MCSKVQGAKGKKLFGVERASAALSLLQKRAENDSQGSANSKNIVDPREKKKEKKRREKR